MSVCGWRRVGALCAHLLLLGCAAAWIVCPDAQFKCTDEETCCQQPTGQYGCCGVPNAVCCEDKVHCCPHGFYCDASTSQCRQKESEKLLLPFLNVKRRSKDVTLRPLQESKEEHPVRSVESTQTMCPDGSECPGTDTCCLQSSGLYGCCDLARAVCCSDGVHCCPEHYRCMKVENSTKIACQPAFIPVVISHSTANNQLNSHDSRKKPMPVDEKPLLDSRNMDALLPPTIIQMAFVGNGVHSRHTGNIRELNAVTGEEGNKGIDKSPL